MDKQTRNIYLVPYVLWIALFVVVPILLVAYYSLFDIEGNFTLANYHRFFSPIYLRMALRSFGYALLVTLFSLLVAYPTAYFLTKAKHKQLWLLLIVMPSWMNLLLKAYAFIGLLGTYGPINAFLEVVGVGARQILFTDFSFIFVAVYIFIPFMILPIFGALEELNPSLVDASHDLGASRWTTFWRVVFPLTLSGVESGCQAVFIPSLSLFMITRLIAGNRVITLGTAIEQHFLVTQDWGMGSALAIILVLIMGLSMIVTTGRKRIMLGLTTLATTGRKKVNHDA